MEKIQSAVAPIKEHVAAGHYKTAFETVGQAMSLVKTYTNGMDFYNFLVLHKTEPIITKRSSPNNGEYSSP